MKYILSFILMLTFSSLKAQKTIKLEDAAKHIGDTVTVVGQTFSVRYLENSKDAPTLINLGAAFPNQLLTVVIYGNSRTNFTFAPELEYLNKKISVTGIIELFKDKPQIVVTKPSQIEIVVN